MSKEYKNFYKRGTRKFDAGDYQGAIDDCSKAIELTTSETDKKHILELRSKVYLMLSNIDLDNSQSL